MHLVRIHLEAAHVEPPDVRDRRVVAAEIALHLQRIARLGEGQRVQHQRRVPRLDFQLAPVP